MKTTHQVAAEIGISRDAVTKAARKLGLKKKGRDHIFSSADVLRIMGRPKRGRPVKGT